MAIRIVLVDDHAVLRAGLKVLIDGERDMHVVGEAGDGREGLRVTSELNPDVVVTDISMPGLNGIEGVRLIKQAQPEIKIIVLSMHSNQEYVTEVLQAGADGYVIKQSDASEVIAAIRAVLAGGAYLSPTISKHLIDGYLSQSPSDIPSAPKLTTREREVAQLIGEGQSTREISETLSISVKTVETHRMNIMKKLNTTNQADIIKYTIKKGWVNLD